MTERPLVKLSGPWKNREADKILKAWGIELDRDTLSMIPHLANGGWCRHVYPAFSEVMVYAEKAAKHTDAALYLHLLCEGALASEYSLTECALLIRECMALDPLRDLAPQNWSSEWAQLLITFVNVWQARKEEPFPVYEALGDSLFLFHFLQQMKALLGEAQLVQMERDIALKREPLQAARRSMP